MVQSKVKVTSPRQLNIFSYSKAISCTIYNGSWQLLSKLGHSTISKFDWVGFLIFVLVSVSRDFELGRNVSCEELTVSPERR